MSFTNALSIDLEDWHHPELVRRHLGDAPTAGRVVEATKPLLDLLERYGVRATFFVVGEVMRRHPALIRRIRADGHEIACHGMTHRPLWALTPDTLEEELTVFREVSRRVLGSDAAIRGFRAPTFSLDGGTRWAVPVLARQGFVYDASVFPAQMGLYGQPGAPLGIHRLRGDGPAGEDPRGSVIELPPATCELLGRRLPVGGGVYLRLLPLWFLTRALKRIARQRPFLIYLHPWETDPGTPRADLPAWARLATYYGIDAALKKAEALLQVFPFTTVWECLGAWERNQPREARQPEAVPAR